jgi:hypothetical protein
VSALTIVRDILADDSGITASVAGRIWPVELPQETGLPAIVLHMVDEHDGRHLGGSDRYPLARVIVDCLGDSYADADGLCDAVKAALIDFAGSVGSATVSDVAHDDLDIFDRGQAGDIWRRRLGFRVRYR